MGDRFSRKGHRLELVVESETQEKQKKTAQATLTKPPGKTFIVHCDEGPYLDGDDTAPPPLGYLTASIAF